MSQAPTQLTRTSSSAGASQLDVAAVWAFTSSKTSPGEARMFINRAVSDIVTGGGLAGCCSKGGGGSCMWFWVRSWPGATRPDWRNHADLSSVESVESVGDPTTLGIRPGLWDFGFQLGCPA